MDMLNLFTTECLNVELSAGMHYALYKIIIILYKLYCIIIQDHLLELCHAAWKVINCQNSYVDPKPLYTLAVIWVYASLSSAGHNYILLV